MAKEQEIQKQAQVAVTPTKRDQWLQNMRTKYPDVQDEDELYGKSMEGYDADHEAVKKFRGEAEQLSEIIAENPDLAEVFSEIFERGKDGHPEVAFAHMKPNFQRLLSDPDYQSEDYIREKERLASEEKAASEKKTAYDQMQQQAFAEVCEEDGIDPQSALEQLQPILQNEPTTLDECKQQVRSFFKMLNYDSDIEAARTQERNKKIVAQRRRQAAQTDGQMNGGSAAAGAQPQKRGNSIFDVARGAE